MANDSRLPHAPRRKTPPTKLKSLADMDRDFGYLFQRDAINSYFVFINDDDEYFAGHLIGYSAAHMNERGGWILDTFHADGGEDGLVEYSALGGERLYLLHERYKELLEYHKEEKDESPTETV